MENNIENIRVKAKVYTNQTLIFILDRMKMSKTLAYQCHDQIFAAMFTSLLVTTLR